MELSKSDSIEKATEKLKRPLNGLILQTLEYTLWGDVYPSCPFTSYYAGGHVFG
jgi:hypothetical protein